MRQILGSCEDSTNHLDNIVVIGTDNAEQDSNLDAVLQLLSDHRATINFEKVELGFDELHFNGFRVSRDGETPQSQNC